MMSLEIAVPLTKESMPFNDILCLLKGFSLPPRAPELASGTINGPNQRSSRIFCF